MKKIINRFKGVVYKSESIYRILTLIKFREKYHLRFKLAAQYIQQGDDVLDLCSGFGELKGYLPEKCEYTCIDASSSFLKRLDKRGIKGIDCDLNKGLDKIDLKADVAVMIVSLYHFKNTAVKVLLEDFKEKANKIVIIECISEKKRSKESFGYKMIRWLSLTHYCDSVELFAYQEFKDVLTKHNYDCKKYNDTYAIGTYFS